MQATAELLQDIVANLGNIVRSEVQLARAEMKQEARKAARDSAMIAAGALLAFFGLAFLFTSAAAVLTRWLPLWGAALLMGVLLFAVSAALAMTGWKNLRRVRPAPEQTIEAVKEDVQWIKDRT